MATGAAVAEVTAPPPKPQPSIRQQVFNNRAKEAKRAEEEEWHREARIAGAAGPAEVAVERNEGYHSRTWCLRHKYKAECRFGPRRCTYWELHDAGIDADCSEHQWLYHPESLPKRRM